MRLIIATQLSANLSLSTVADLQLSLYADNALPLADLHTRWCGGFYALLNVASAVCQFVVAPVRLAFAPG